MARLALRLLLLAASVTRASAGFYVFIIFNDNGTINPLTYAVDGALAIAFGLLVFFRIGRRAEQAERRARDPIYTGTVIIRNIAATSSLVENDGAELTSYRASISAPNWARSGSRYLLARKRATRLRPRSRSR